MTIWTSEKGSSRSRPTAARSAASARGFKATRPAFRRVATASATDGSSDQTAALQDQEDAMHTRLVQQFASMDAKVASYKSTQTFLQAQIDAWNGKNNN